MCVSVLAKKNKFLSIETLKKIFLVWNFLFIEISLENSISLWMREKESKLNLPYSENFVLVEFNESQEEKKWTKLSCHELYKTRLEKNSVDTKWNWENSK